jgi:hypothetical protein
MPNLEIANAAIADCNVKFGHGTGNLKNGPFELEEDVLVRNRQLTAYRVDLNKTVPATTTEQYTVTQRAFDTGKALDNMPEAKVGNCAERCYWIYYKLTMKGIPNVTVLSGHGTESINHDFIAIGATGIKDGHFYSQDRAPSHWQGSDVVICDPWFQAGTFSYAFGIAYPLAQWSTWIPKIIDKSLSGRPQEKTLNRKRFHLARYS